LAAQPLEKKATRIVERRGLMTPLEGATMAMDRAGPICVL
jgi:hypothetical protein